MPWNYKDIRIRKQTFAESQKSESAPAKPLRKPYIAKKNKEPLLFREAVILMLRLINHRNVSKRLLTEVRRLSITVLTVIGDTLILCIRVSIFGIFTIKAIPSLSRESMPIKDTISPFYIAAVVVFRENLKLFVPYLSFLSKPIMLSVSLKWTFGKIEILILVNCRFQFLTFYNMRCVSTPVDYIVHNGMMKDMSVLQESPFTDKGSIVGIFSDMSVWMGIKSVIDRINANAAA